MWLSLTILIAMVAVAATGTIDLLPAALITVGVLVVSKCISLDEAFRAIKGRVLLAIVVTFGVSTAMKSSGVAAFVAEGIVALCTPMGPRGLIGAIFLVGACVGCVVSNNATVTKPCLRSSEAPPVARPHVLIPLHDLTGDSHAPYLLFGGTEG